MTPATANTGSGAAGDDRESGRDLLLGRVGQPGASRKPAAPQRAGGGPSRLADDALLREILQRIDELSERTAATERDIHDTSATLERIAPVIDKIVQNQGDRSRAEADKTTELSLVMSRLEGVEEKMPDAAASTAKVKFRVLPFARASAPGRLKVTR